MSCNGCRALQEGCTENCIFRQSLHGIESHRAQANATVFAAKFFGRAALMSFLSSVPESQRPAMFESLLFEACGRTVNLVNGAVGLLGTGNWHVCESAVEAVLRGEALQPILELFLSGESPLEESDGASGTNNVDLFTTSRKNNSQRLTTVRHDPAAYPETRVLNSEELRTAFESVSANRLTATVREVPCRNSYQKIHFFCGIPFKGRWKTRNSTTKMISYH